MTKDTTERVKNAQNKALEYLDYILEMVPASDFVEIVGRVGGDVVTYRVYDDGSVYEKRAGRYFMMRLDYKTEKFQKVSDVPLPLINDNVPWLQEGDFEWM